MAGIHCNYCVSCVLLMAVVRSMPIDEIEVIKQKLVDQIKPIGVYLFGSFANGTAHADSDFDFYIIVDDNEKDLHAVATSA